MPAAAKALRMNSYSNIGTVPVVGVIVLMAMLVQMIGALHVAAARQYENVTGGMHHVDIDTVKLRQNRRGHDLVHGAEHSAAVAEIKHAVQRTDELVEL